MKDRPRQGPEQAYATGIITTGIEQREDGNPDTKFEWA